MRKITKLAAPLMAAFMSAHTARAAPPDFNGSDTLEALIGELVRGNCDGALNINLSGLLNYVGGGSGTGANAMIAQLSGGSRQLAGPMSRAISANECAQLPAAVQATTQGLVVGLDGIDVVVDSQNSVACGGGHPAHDDDQSHSDTVFSALAGSGDSFAYSGGTYLLGGGSQASAGWKDLLRLLYTGLRHSDPNPPSASASLTGDCKSPERRALVANYANLYHGGCTATGCTQGIKRAFRRADLSGTTDTFLSLIGAPAIVLSSGKATKTPFCNGLDTEDKDPIRRACDDTEQVCEADGSLGVVLPVLVPTGDRGVVYNAALSPAGDPLGDVARFGKIRITPGVSCVNAPGSNAPNPAMELDATKPDATPGSAGWNLPAGFRFPNNPRCDCRFPTPEDYLTVRDAANAVVAFPKNNAFAWNKRSGGCPATYRAGGPDGGTEPAVRYGLLNGQDSSGDNSPSYWGTTYVSGTKRICCSNNGVRYTMDPRQMNLQLRDPAPSNGGALLGGPSAPVSVAAFYRIHSTGKGPQVIPNRSTQQFVQGVEDCMENDSTLQIACLVQVRSTCSVGFAGREAADSITALVAEPLSVGVTSTSPSIAPTVINIQKLVSSDPAVRAVAYPLARRLYYNTLIGFGNGQLVNPNGSASTYENAQFNLYKCLADASPDRLNGISGSLKALERAGYVELPGGPKLCNNMCTTNPTCATLTNVPAADLLPAFIDPP